MSGSGAKTGMVIIQLVVTLTLKDPLQAQHECLKEAVGIALLIIAPLERVVILPPRIRLIIAAYVWPSRTFC